MPDFYLVADKIEASVKKLGKSSSSLYFFADAWEQLLQLEEMSLIEQK